MSDDHYYDGIMAFKRWRNENSVTYDWADLTDAQRAEWRRKEAEEERGKTR